MRNISRLKTGWQIKRQIGAAFFQPYFSDQKWGGATKALAAALAERDRLNKVYGESSYFKGYRRINKSNKTGTVGIALIVTKRENRITPILAISTYYGSGKNQRKKFKSVYRYGLVDCFIECWNWRMQNLKLPLDVQERNKALAHFIRRLEESELIYDFPELRKGIQSYKRRNEK